MFLWSFPVVTAGLGIWQVYRYQWKLNLIKQAQDSLDKKPLKDPTNEPYRRIQLNGTLEDEKILVNGVENGVRGHYVIQPYIINNQRILIQRGFQKDGKTLTTTSDQGLVLQNEQQGYRPDNNNTVWYWKDINTISKLFHTDPILIGMIKNEQHKSGIEAKPGYHNNHMQYIITWFTLSVFTAAAITFKRKKTTFRI